VFDGNCRYCGHYGHKESDCRKKKREEERKKASQAAGSRKVHEVTDGQLQQSSSASSSQTPAYAPPAVSAVHAEYPGLELWSGASDYNVVNINVQSLSRNEKLSMNQAIVKDKLGNPVFMGLSDNGSEIHCIPPWFAPDVPLEPLGSRGGASAADGNSLQAKGWKTLDIKLERGPTITVRFLVCNVKRVIFSEGLLARSGFNF